MINGVRSREERGEDDFDRLVASSRRVRFDEIHGIASERPSPSLW